MIMRVCVGNVPKERPYLVAGDVSWDSGTKEKQRISGGGALLIILLFYYSLGILAYFRATLAERSAARTM